jgi:hypothetical protein
MYHSVNAIRLSMQRPKAPNPIHIRRQSGSELDVLVYVLALFKPALHHTLGLCETVIFPKPECLSPQIGTKCEHTLHIFK